VRYHCALWSIRCSAWSVANRVNIICIDFRVRFNIFKADEILKKYEFLVLWECKLLELLFSWDILRCFFFSLLGDFRFICVFILRICFRFLCTITCLFFSKNHLLKPIAEKGCSFCRELHLLWRLQTDNCLDFLKTKNLFEQLFGAENSFELTFFDNFFDCIILHCNDCQVVEDAGILQEAIFQAILWEYSDEIQIIRIVVKTSV